MKKLLMLIAVLLLTLVLPIAAEPESKPTVDIDLSAFNRGMVYAQMSSVLRAPELYEGKVFRVKGQFNYSEKRQTATLIFVDSAGCCEVSLAVRSDQLLSYPEDYPPLYAQATVTGRLTFDPDSPDETWFFSEAYWEWK